jgi:hypothetical protein
MRRRGDHNRRGALEDAALEGAVEQAQALLAHDVAVPRNDNRQRCRQRERSQVRHRIRKMQVHQVEAVLGVQSPRPQRHRRADRHARDGAQDADLVRRIAADAVFVKATVAARH